MTAATFAPHALLGLKEPVDDEDEDEGEGEEGKADDDDAPGAGQRANATAEGQRRDNVQAANYNDNKSVNSVRSPLSGLAPGASPSPARKALPKQRTPQHEDDDDQDGSYATSAADELIVTADSVGCIRIYRNYV